MSRAVLIYVYKVTGGNTGGRPGFIESRNGLKTTVCTVLLVDETIAAADATCTTAAAFLLCCQCRPLLSL